MQVVAKLCVCALVALPPMTVAFQAEARGAKRAFVAGVVAGKAAKAAHARERANSDVSEAEASAETTAPQATPEAGTPETVAAPAPAPVAKAAAVEVPPAGGVTCFAGCYDNSRKVAGRR